VDRCQGVCDNLSCTGAALLTVLTQNAFSERLQEFGFDFHRMLVPDLLHEFELGVWKATFIHLLRTLQYFAKASLQKLDER
jgi:hypothetical protein